MNKFFRSETFTNGLGSVLDTGFAFNPCCLWDTASLKNDRRLLRDAIKNRLCGTAGVNTRCAPSPCAQASQPGIDLIASGPLHLQWPPKTEVRLGRK